MTRMGAVARLEVLWRCCDLPLSPASGPGPRQAGEPPQPTATLPTKVLWVTERAEDGNFPTLRGQ